MLYFLLLYHNIITMLTIVYFLDDYIILYSFFNTGVLFAHTFFSAARVARVYNIAGQETWRPWCQPPKKTLRSPSFDSPLNLPGLMPVPRSFFLTLFSIFHCLRPALCFLFRVFVDFSLFYFLVGFCMRHFPPIVC